MASYYTHYRCATRAAKNFSDRAREVVESRPEVYLAGAQGPDLLFYVFGKFRGYGSKVHCCAIYEQFAALARLCASTKSDDMLAYTLGYAAHYAVDREMHPLVIHESETYMRRFFKPDLYESLHMMQEAAIDRILFLRDSGANAQFRAKHFLPYTDASRTAFATAMTEIGKIFGTQVPFEKLFDTQKRMVAYQSVYDHRFSPTCLFVQAAGALMGKPNYIYGFLTPPLDKGIDYMNAERRPYPSVTGEYDSPSLDLSVDSVLENAHLRTLDLAAKIVGAVEGKDTLSPSDFELSFSGRRVLAPHEYFRGADD